MMLRNTPWVAVAAALVCGAPPALAAPTKAIAKAPFCQDDAYALDAWERDWCSVIDDPNKICPSLPDACANENRRKTEYSNDGTGRIRVRWGAEGEGEGEGEGVGEGEGEGEGDAAPTPPPELDEPPEPPEPPEPEDPWEVPKSMSLFAKIMFFVMLGAALIWLIWAIWKNRVKGKDEDPDDLVVPKTGDDATDAVAAARQVETDVDRLLRLAHEAAARGEFEAGIDHAYAAALRRLEGDGLIDMHNSLTNGDYVRGLNSQPALANPLREIVRDVERVQFGTTPPDAALFERVLGRVLPLVNRTAAVLLLLVGSGLLWSCNDTLATKLPTQETDTPGGVLGVIRLLDENDVRAELRVAPLEEIDDRTGTLVLMPGTEHLLHGAKSEVYDWVRDGGKLVLAGVLPEDDTVAISTKITRYTNPELTLESDFYYWGDMDARAPAGPALVMRPGDYYGLPALTRPNGDIYAASNDYGDGQIIVLADDRLISNIALAAGDNADMMVKMLHSSSKVELSTAGLTGAAAASPLESIHNARLTPLIIQLLVLLILFMLWRGIAFGRLRDPPEHSRRSYADHVKALGTQYARAGASAHALGAYARWALERLRERVPRGRHVDMDELAEEIAARSGRPLDYVRVVLNQAHAATEAFGPASVRSESFASGAASVRHGPVAAAPGPDHHIQLMRQLTDLLGALGRGHRTS